MNCSDHHKIECDMHLVNVVAMPNIPSSASASQHLLKYITFPHHLIFLQATLEGNWILNKTPEKYQSLL